jgi:hypothetical protein
MDAYELANRVEDDFYLNEAAKMLRQQADRIKELETKYKQEFDYVEKLLKKCT